MRTSATPPYQDLFERKFNGFIALQITFFSTSTASDKDFDVPAYLSSMTSSKVRDLLGNYVIFAAVRVSFADFLWFAPGISADGLPGLRRPDLFLAVVLSQGG